ncbi:uncharacterized protein LOC134855914 [Symsagittifera roscoffensis]|uniref:uncharacterized protein LOC134855914 n=1 Tax=Symsagittifera roscoffensis TaxID=84072 RepID=UPI00307C8D7A
MEHQNRSNSVTQSSSDDECLSATTDHREEYQEPESSFSASLKPPDKLTWQVIMATVFSTLGCMNFGYALGWSAQSIDNIKDDPDMPNFSDTQNSWISSILTIGAILGTFIGADLSDRLGRQQTLIATAIVAVGGWIVVCLANSFVLVAVGRFVVGMSIGMVNTSSPPYIAEITPPNYRGVTGGQFQNGVNGGIFICLLIAPYLPWRTLSVLGLIFPSLMGVGLMFMRESPVWLLSKGHIDKYDKSSRFFAGSTHVFYTNIAPSFSESQSQQGPTESVSVRWRKLLRNPQTYKPLLLCMFMALAFQLSAVTVITFYNVTIFSNAGLSSSKANMSSQILGAFQLIIGVAGSVLSTTWRRKPHFLTSSYLTSSGLCLIAISFLVKEKWYDSSIMDWVVIGSFVFTISIFAFGAGTITWAYVGELLPAEGTGLVVGAASFANWFVSFFLAFYYDQMQKAMEDYGVFFFYAAAHFLCTCCLVWLPETKGMSLAEIQSSFKSRRRRHRNKRNPHSQQFFAHDVED